MSRNNENLEKIQKNKIEKIFAVLAQRVKKRKK